LSGNKKKTQLEWQRGNDKKGDKYIAVNCTWYRIDGQTNKSKKMTTGTI
jgi:hypothetical protein